MTQKQISILYVAQWSMFSDGKFLCGTDYPSLALNNFIQMFGKDKKTNYSITVIVPEGITINDIIFDKYKKLISNNELLINLNNDVKVTTIQHKWFSNLLINRYNFVFSWYSEVLTSGKYDIILNLIPEIARNIKSVLKVNNLNSKIITWNNWVDIPSESVFNDTTTNYFFRQVDGVYSSDLYLFASESNQRSFEKGVKENIKSPLPNTLDWIPTAYFKQYSDFLIDKKDLSIEEINSLEPIKYSPNEVVIFAERISSTGYTNHEMILNAFSNPYLTKYMLLVMNPSKMKGLDLIQQSFPDWKFDEVKLKFNNFSDGKYQIVEAVKHANAYIILSQLSHDDFLKISNYANASISYRFKEKYGSSTIRETAFAGNCLPVVPQVNEYAKWYKDNGYYIKKSMKNQEKNLLSAVDTLMSLDQIHRKKLLNEVKANMLTSCSLDHDEKRVMSLFKSVIK